MYHRAGKIMPLHSPNPTYPLSSCPARPVIVTLSPSSKKILVSELPGNCSGFFPPSVASRSEPCVPFSVPLMVPEPSKSPTLRLHPVMVWWAIICGNDQRRLDELVLVRFVLLPEAAARFECLRQHIKLDSPNFATNSLFSSTSSWISSTLSFLSSTR